MRHWTSSKQGKLFWNKEAVAKDTGLSGKTLDNYLKIFKLRTEFIYVIEDFDAPTLVTNEQIEQQIKKFVSETPTNYIVTYDKLAQILFDKENKPRPEFSKYFNSTASKEIITKKTFKPNPTDPRKLVQYLAHMPKNSTVWEMQLHVLFLYQYSIMAYNYRAYPGLHTHF